MTDTDAEPELTETQKAYNVAEAKLFQLAAYGHHKYWPLVGNDGSYLSEREQEVGRRNYCERIRRAQAEFEAAALRLAADSLTAACPDHTGGGTPFIACQCAAADALRRQANEALAVAP